MKKYVAMMMAAVLLMGVLSGCGGKKQEETVDLSAFYAGLEETYDWGDGYMVDIEGEILENYYPGLDAIEKEQFIAKTPIMNAVNEVVFLQCKSEDDAQQAAEILQGRIDSQASGGAWYPEAIEAWGRGSVIRHGTYVAMIACIQDQTAVEDAFNALF